MNQNSGQNLDDLLKQLKQLKNAVDENEAPTDTYDNLQNDEDMSAEELQSKLKNQFISEGDGVEKEDGEYSEESYQLDDDFLS